MNNPSSTFIKRELDLRILINLLKHFFYSGEKKELPKFLTRNEPNDNDIKLVLASQTREYMKEMQKDPPTITKTILIMRNMKVR